MNRAVCDGCAATPTKDLRVFFDCSISPTGLDVPRDNREDFVFCIDCLVDWVHYNSWEQINLIRRKEGV